MGGEGSGRPPSVDTIVKRDRPVETPVGTGVFLPNYSGVQEAALKTSAAMTSGAHATTHEAAGGDEVEHDKLVDFVANEHIDWTADVSPVVINAANYTDTTYTAGDFAHNSLSGLNDGTTYEHLTAAQVTEIAVNTAAIPDLSGNVAINTAAVPDLSGNIATNVAVIDDLSGNAYTHINDNTQAHTDYLLNSEADTGVGLNLTGDLTASGNAAVHNMIFDTSDTPPAASGFAQGTIYVQYTE